MPCTPPRQARALLTLSAALLLMFGLLGCRSSASSAEGAAPDQSVASSTSPTTGASESQPAASSAAKTSAKTGGSPLAGPPPEGRQVATFAGGCFWCMEGPFEKIEGVDEVLSGYTGGSEQAPTYKQVSAGRTSHTEAVRVVYDPQRVTYDMLLDAFWRSMDPTDAGGQFADRGRHYRPAIYVHDEAQRAAAEASRKALGESGRFDKPIVVPVEPAQDFWIAEEYHQDYYKKEPGHYNRYREGSGRGPFLKRVWGEQR